MIANLQIEKGKKKRKKENLKVRMRLICIHVAV